MIRRAKKIIKLRNPFKNKRKNPGWELEKDEVPEDYIKKNTVSDKLITDIRTIFMFGNIKSHFSNLVCLWNQGTYCFDCVNKYNPDNPVNYTSCTCEKCYECYQKYCICPLDDDENIYKTTWEFSKFVLDDDTLYQIKIDLNDNLKLSPGRSKSKTLNSISKDKHIFSPSYPKYKKIAKELFRL